MAFPGQRPDNFTLVGTSSLATGLVGAWLGKLPGTTAYNDSSANARNGTLANYTGTGDTPADRWTQSAQLQRWTLDSDGSDDDVAIAGVPYSGTLTFSGWFKRPSTIVTGDTSGYSNCVLACRHTAAGSKSDWMIQFNDAGDIWISIPWGANNIIVQAGIWTDATAFHHIALTRTGSSGAWTYKLYFDGTLAATGTTATDPDTADTHPIHLFGAPGSYQSRATAADVMYHARELTTAEITALATAANNDLTISGSATLVDATASSYTLAPSATMVVVNSAVTVTVTPDSYFTGTITLTPSGTAATGLVATTLTWSGTADAKTATFTPTATGTLTITGSDSASLTDPSPASITVTSPSSERCPTVLADAESGVHAPDFAMTSILPTGNAWYAELRRDISADAVDPNSTRWCQMLADEYGGAAIRSLCRYLPTSSGTPSFATYPYMIVDRETQPYTHVPARIGASDLPAQDWMLPAEPIAQEANPTGQYAVRGVTPWFNTASDSPSDFHFLVVVREAGTPVEVWEYFNSSVEYDGSGNISKLVATAFRYYDLTDTTPPAMGTSAVGAGGLPTLPLCFTMSELLAGEIAHALRFSCNATMCCNFNAWPSLTVADGFRAGGFPLGSRLRIRADRLDALRTMVGNGQARVVLEAMAKYGIILDDYVGDSYFWLQGAIDGRYDDTDMQKLLDIHPATDMEFVQTRYLAKITGPTTLRVGESGTFTATSDMPAGVDYGVSIRFYRTDDPSMDNPTDYGLLGTGGVGPATPVQTGPMSFSTPGTYYPATNYQFARYYVEPHNITVTAADGSPATTYMLALSGGVEVGERVVVTITPDGDATGSITLTPSGCGLTAPVTVNFSGSTPVVAYFLPVSGPGTLSISASNTAGLAEPSGLPATRAISAATDGGVTIHATMAGTFVQVV